MSDSNGGAQADLIDRLAAELRAGIAAEQATRVEHERVVAESVARERRLQRTLTALEGTGPGRKPQTQARPAGGGTKPWVVSEGRVQAALAVLKEQAKPMSVPELAHAMGGSTETARRALEQLRQRSLVRLAGTERRGANRQATKMFALMPGADDGAA